MRIVIIVFLGVLVVFNSCRNEKKPEEVKATFVLSDKMLETTKTETVSLQPLKNVLHFHGKISAENNKMIEIFPVVGGNVATVLVELGDYVKKDQLLATIVSTEVAGFEKELDDAKNDVVIAKNNVKVAQELFDGKLSAERDVLGAKSELDKALSQLHRIQEIYNIYNIKGGAVFEVRAPLSGFIVEKNINQDMLLSFQKTDNIFDIAQIDEVWAIANVNEIDINQVKLGINAEVSTLSYPDKIFHGKVDKIFNIIDPETKTMKAIVILNNSQYLLKPEMRATIKLFYNEDRQMISVPSNALIFIKGKNYVMIFKDKNNIETRQVEVFRQVGETSFISSGLSEGEKVISENQLLIYDALND
ncbi:MAG: efflux RND transporter periplasmic adaptor subunit [Sediminibacterium sp.]|nr:efflux RND transporter periplasmic adaptor subunit [Sediminibacterium sp.]